MILIFNYNYSKVRILPLESLNNRELSSGQKRRMSKLRKQLNVYSSDVIKDFYISNKRSSTRSSRRKSNELLGKSSLINSFRKLLLSIKESNPSIDQSLQ
uniref:Maturase K n=1 Tax=Strongyloides venezuelensis TaxID=75913 RepID=A0A0K0FI11_STRVS